MAKIDWSQYRETPSSGGFNWSQYKESDSQQNPSEVWSSFGQGLKEGYPSALKSGINAASELIGKKPFEDDELEHTESWPRTIGRFLSETAGYGTLGAPLTLAGGAALPFAGAEIGAGLSGALTTKGGLKDRLVSGALSTIIPSLRHTPAAAVRLTKASFAEPKPKAAAKLIQSAHDQAHQAATSPLNEAAEEAIKRKISPIPTPEWVEKLINEKGVFSRTPANKRMLENAATGSHKGVRDLQIDLFKKSQKLLQPTKTAAENNLGEELEAARQASLESMHRHYQQEGSQDLADKIKQGMAGYRNLKETFGEEKVIADLVGKKKKIPKNLIDTLRTDSAYYQKLRNSIPELNKIIQHAEDKELLKKIGKHIGYKSGAAAALKTLLPSQHNDD